MTRRHVPVARLTALAAVAVGAVVLARGTQGLHWRTLHPGVEFTTLRGEPYCRRGSTDIAVLRVDPSRVRMRVLHYSRAADRPLEILEWQRRTGALAVFNAGQYYADYSYMGRLVSAGRVISARIHPQFKAALVADGRRARVLDLERESMDADSARWSDVAQSFMLFDRAGGVRVRKSDLVANRTVVGEDRAGRLVALTTEGGYTLWELAKLLQDGPLDLAQAMAMDGGHEAEMCVKAGRFRYASFGHWNEKGMAAEAGAAQVPLPAVVAVLAR